MAFAVSVVGGRSSKCRGCNKTLEFGKTAVRVGAPRKQKRQFRHKSQYLTSLDFPINPGSSYWWYCRDCAEMIYEQLGRNLVDIEQ